MVKSSEKPVAVAGIMMILALCYQVQAPQWIYAGMAGFAGAGAALWFRVEKRVTSWMPDSEFPNWLLTKMS
ncbi:MAG: hypothetical protein GY948_01150 [Alphaproteobacteria bacterium]|nr:hypothetical protein [Alphaproteobacteria bacterium]